MNQNSLNSKIEQYETYSASETHIGTFLGKKLYRKVFEYSNVTFTSTNEVVLTSNHGITASKVVRTYGTLHKQGQVIMSNGMYFAVYLNTSNALCARQSISGSVTGTVYAIVEYTE